MTGNWMDTVSDITRLFQPRWKMVAGLDGKLKLNILEHSLMLFQQWHWWLLSASNFTFVHAI